jgi:hypothetical protein
MSVKDMLTDELPSSDLPEIMYRLKDRKDRLEDVNDDYTRQEIYDRISMSAIIIQDCINDLAAIWRVMKAVVDA